LIQFQKDIKQKREYMQVRKGVKVSKKLN